MDAFSAFTAIFEIANPDMVLALEAAIFRQQLRMLLVVSAFLRPQCGCDFPFLRRNCGCGFKFVIFETATANKRMRLEVSALPQLQMWFRHFETAIDDTS